MTELDAAKQAARAAARGRRTGLDPATAGRSLTRHVLLQVPPPAGAVVAGFWPLPDEIDLRPLLLALHGRGHPVVLPVTPPRGQPLLFRRWRPDDTMSQGRFGTPLPIGEAMTPDFILVPLLAYDLTGARLGYGGGYYDRTLAGLPGRFRLGCGFAEQQVDAVPVGPYDETMDAVATQFGIVRFGG